MADMHDAGLVHLNIKPSNIMWFPQGGHWSITDFGFCARVGEAAPVASTLAYSAPEVVRAYLSSQDCMAAAPAMDCWALGIVALELFAGTPTFDLVQGGPVQVRLLHNRSAVLHHLLFALAGTVAAHQIPVSPKPGYSSSECRGRPEYGTVPTC